MDRGAVTGAVTEVWLVRHTAVKVPRGMCYGRSDVPLRDSFADEAEAVCDGLRGVDFDSVWCSPLGRCTKLAGACGYPDARLDDRLLELDFGDWELRYFDEIDDPQLQIWYADHLRARPTGGETFTAQCARVAQFLDEVGASGQRRALVFTHGGVVVAAGIAAGLFTPEEAFSHIPPYGSITKIDIPRPL